MKLYHKPLPNNGFRIGEDLDRIHSSLKEMKNVKRFYGINIISPFLKQDIPTSQILEIVKLYLDEKSFCYDIIKELLSLPVVDDNGKSYPLNLMPPIGEITRVLEDLVLTEIFDRQFVKMFPGVEFRRYISRVYIACREGDDVFFDEIGGNELLSSISLRGHIIEIRPGTSVVSCRNQNVGLDNEGNIIVWDSVVKDDDPMMKYPEHWYYQKG